MMEFFRPLQQQRDATILKAYVPEILPLFVDIVCATDFNGTPLNFLDQLEMLIAWLGSSIPEYEAALLQAKTHLEKEKTKIITTTQRREGSEADLTSHYLNKGDFVWIPLVEREPLLPGIQPMFGMLQQLRVNVQFNSKSNANDRLYIQHFSDESSTNDADVPPTVKAAKHLAKKLAHLESHTPLIINCSFDQPYTVIGESLEAGIAAALFTELLQLLEFRDEYAVRKNVAITGRINQEGTLLSVDEDGLRLKIEACAYSSVKYLVVPKQQEDIAKELAGRLAESTHNSSSPQSDIIHPVSQLEIIGISNLEDIFLSRRLTDSRRVPGMKRTARKVWRARRTIAALVVITLLAVIAKMMYGPLDKNPVTLVAEGTTLSAQNKGGDTIATIEVGKATAKLIGDMGTRRGCLYDVDADGVKEIIWGTAEQDRVDGKSFVNCRTVGQDTNRWSVELTRSLDFPFKRAESAETRFVFQRLLVGDLDANGSTEVYISTSHHLFQSIFLKVDATTGGELGCYVNVGGLAPFDSVDLDGDGIVELLLGGANNALHKAVLVALDPRFIDGHSPLTPEYALNGIPPARERAYVSIPRNSIVEAAGSPQSWLITEEVTHQPSNKTITITVRDVAHIVGNVSTIIHFGYDLLPQSPLQTASDFDLLVDSLLALRKIRSKPDEEYWKEYVKGIQYWNDERFVNKPVFARVHSSPSDSLSSERIQHK